MRSEAAAVTAAATASPIPALAAQTFVDSVGANVHLVDTGNGYDPSKFPTLLSLIAGAGIRHLRDGMIIGNSTVVSEAQQLASKGVRFDYIMGTNETASQASGWFSSVGSNVADACEGVNEPDGAGGTWAPNAVSEQKAIYGVCHPMGFPVYASAMSQGSDYATFGNVSAEADYANVHDYFSWRNPGTVGYGNGGYGSLAYSESNASAEAPNDPFVATETGYSSYSGDAYSNYVPEAIRARYLARTFLEGFRSGVKRTYMYEFADEGGTQAYDNMGLVDTSLNTKASYGAVGGLLNMLSDPNVTFTPGSLGYTITGGDANIHTVLLQKHDGSFWLALWEEKEEWAGDGTQTQESIPVESLTLSFAQTPSSITTHVLQDAGTYTSTAVTPASSIVLSVDGHPTIVQIAPTRAVSLLQSMGANNSSIGSYSLTLPSAAGTGDAIIAGLAASPSVTSSISGFTVVDANASNGQIESSLDDHVVASGNSSTLNVTVNGNDWASGLAFEVSGQDPSTPIAYDTSADSTNANVTCPAPASGTTIRAGSLVTCIIYVNGGTQNSGLAQSPTPPSGWVFDRNSNNPQYNEVYLFHRTAPTSAGESVSSTVINLSATGGSQYLTGTHAQTLIIQPHT